MRAINARSTPDQRWGWENKTNKTNRRQQDPGYFLKDEAVMEDQEGYSAMFYIMLLLGIVGVLGFVLVAAAAV